MHYAVAWFMGNLDCSTDGGGESTFCCERENKMDDRWSWTEGEKNFDMADQEPALDSQESCLLKSRKNHLETRVDNYHPCFNLHEFPGNHILDNAVYHNTIPFHNEHIFNPIIFYNNHKEFCSYMCIKRKSKLEIQATYISHRD